MLTKTTQRSKALKWRDFNKELTYVSVDGSSKSKRNRIMPIPEFIRKELSVGDRMTISSQVAH